MLQSMGSQRVGHDRVTEQLHGAKCSPARRLCLPQVERDGLGRENVVSQRRGVESGARLPTFQCCQPLFMQCDIDTFPHT